MKKPWVRLVLATSIDGRVSPPEGGKANLGGDGDREVLEEALEWADAAMMGGGTIREHKSICLIKDSSLVAKRKSKRKSPQPIAIVVGSENIFSPEWPFFQQPVKRWILTDKNTSHKKYIQNSYHRILILRNTWAENLSDIYKEGISRLVLLGGPKLIESLLNEDQVDELQLTFTPRIIGGGNIWPTSNAHDLPIAITKNDSWKLKKIMPLINEEIMLSYLRNR